MPSFADFLISVEAEMNKVSWPTRTELIRASIVVILMIFLLAAILFAYDSVPAEVIGSNNALSADRQASAAYDRCDG